MPVPGGDISTSQIWISDLIKEVEENPKMQDALLAADAEEATAEYVEDEDDLPELP